jgi:hypothetical protein
MESTLPKPKRPDAVLILTDEKRGVAVIFCAASKQSAVIPAKAIGEEELDCGFCCGSPHRLRSLEEALEMNLIVTGEDNDTVAIGIHDLLARVLRHLAA